MRTQKGFTLIELVVTMVIAAILAAIAIPAYSNYVRKSHRTDAKSALLDLASLEERYFSTQNSYSSNWSDLGYGASAANGASIASPNGYYTLSPPTVVTATAPTSTTPGTPATYSFTATATGNQLKDTTCKTYTVTSAGSRTAQDASSTDTTSSCW
jgi:type IV pilus assembly protein PilE